MKIYEILAGSHLYGTSRPDSDIDTRSIHMLSMDEFFWADGRTITHHDKQSGVDSESTELKKFVQLCLQNNPNILDILFSKQHLFMEPVFAPFIAYRQLILSKKIKKTFLGYAHAQLHRIKNHRRWIENPPEPPAKQEKASEDWKKYSEWYANRNPERHALELKYGYDVKHAAHLFRLLIQCQNILTDCDYNPTLEGEDLRFVQDILYGSFSYQSIIDSSEIIFNEVSEMKSDLPDEPDYGVFEDLVLVAYQDYWRLKSSYYVTTTTGNASSPVSGGGVGGYGSAGGAGAIINIPLQ